MTRFTDLFSNNPPEDTVTPETRFMVVGERPLDSAGHYWQRLYPRPETLGALFGATKEDLFDRRGKIVDHMARHFDSLKIIDRRTAHEMPETVTIYLVNNSASFASMAELKNAASEDDQKLYARFADNNPQTAHASLLSFVGQFGEQNVLLRPDSKILVLEADSGAIIFGNPLYLSDKNAAYRRPIQQATPKPPQPPSFFNAFKKLSSFGKE